MTDFDDEEDSRDLVVPQHYDDDDDDDWTFRDGDTFIGVEGWSTLDTESRRERLRWAGQRALYRRWSDEAIARGEIPF